MLVEQARRLAVDWVRVHADGPLPVVGAFFTGSTVEAQNGDELAPTSDVDITVVLDGPVPAKPGKLDHGGALVEVTYLPWDALADPEVVARTSFLAPSFARDTVISDPEGLLRALREAVTPLVWRRDVLLDRCRFVLDRMTAEPRPTSSWARAVTGWLFPASLSTNVVLVAARRNPTVRLRYLRARAALAEHAMAERYPPLLDQLGCRAAPAALVAQHLATMTAAFDAAAAGPPADFFFAADLTSVARPVAVDGAHGLIAAGDHREAVFWLVATFARCVQALDATGSPDAAVHGETFALAVADLLGLATRDDLVRRRAAVLATVPALLSTAEEIIDRSGGHPASAG